MQNKSFLEVVTQEQELPTWCWAAVGSVCALFYEPNSGWSQCKVVSKTLDISNCCDKSAKNAKCDTFWYLFDGQHHGSLDTLGIANGLFEGAVSFEKVIEQIELGFPIAYRVKADILSHFVVCSGYDNTNNKQIIKVNDSMGETSLIDYNKFIKGYFPNSTITHTFFTKKMQ